MKKRIVSMLLCAASLGAYAQQKGDMFASFHGGVDLVSYSIQYGEIDYVSYDEPVQEKNDPNVNFFVAPGFHYFVANRFRVGLDFTFGIEKAHGEYGLGSMYLSSDSKSKYWSLGPVFAGYVKLAEKFYYVPELDLNYIRMKASEDVVYMYSPQYYDDLLFISDVYQNTALNDDLKELGGYSYKDQPMDGISFSVRLFQLEFRPAEHWGFALNLIDLTFSHFFKKEKNEVINGVNVHTPSVKNNGLSIGVNPAFGVHIYF